ncbi:MAG: tRNA 2-selenouridine(34) synthase MnmH [Rhodoferax sp.]|uniref:tRNA 2-selenouridine(34) synthase MnmH n=1 Tax=Rhodoferax sp. TaxID=50421 RepID=UPI002717A800|nr:tRNA 2-selenouridine(34) synthase MnmH [Rhodoferax sp.]MDO8450107.1 tRNA 2-selenouridine(34) synthase MnmH [Rhodoferax sp.]
MSLTTLSASEVIQRLHEFDTVIDARSEGEFAEDHLPQAVNWPTLNDEERRDIGTLYKQVNAFEAKKRGAAIAARNIAAHIDREVIDKPKDWKPLAYCWRGGKRSGSLSLILSEIGFRVTLVEGGYKAFRAAVVEDIPRLVSGLEFRVICGTTGSGKTRLLQALAAQGAQVIDLEALANHRSSVLGAIPGMAQPTQKRFDTLVWDALRRLDRTRPVFIESESKKVGNVAVPVSLVEAMRQSTCLNLVLPDAERVALLMEDYDFFVRDVEHFCERLQILTEFRGKVVVEGWKASVRAGDIEPVVQELLTQHYDPVYLQSMRRNFVQFEQAKLIAPEDHSTGAMAFLAQQLMAETP